jgi:hypothetical protein
MTSFVSFLELDRRVRGFRSFHALSDLTCRPPFFRESQTDIPLRGVLRGCIPTQAFLPGTASYTKRPRRSVSKRREFTAAGLHWGAVRCTGKVTRNRWRSPAAWSRLEGRTLAAPAEDTGSEHVGMQDKTVAPFAPSLAIAAGLGTRAEPDLADESSSFGRNGEPTVAVASAARPVRIGPLELSRASC